MPRGSWRQSGPLNGSSLAIVDTGPLYAVADSDDGHHDRCLTVLEREDLELVIPAMVVAEVTYLLRMRLGATAEAAFLRGLAGFAIEAPGPQDWVAMADLVERSADFPLGGTDASLAVLADRLGTDLIVTLDRRHFAALRAPGGGAYRLLPED